MSIEEEVIKSIFILWMTLYILINLFWNYEILILLLLLLFASILSSPLQSNRDYKHMFWNSLSSEHLDESVFFLPLIIFQFKWKKFFLKRKLDTRKKIIQFPFQTLSSSFEKKLNVSWLYYSFRIRFDSKKKEEIPHNSPPFIYTLTPWMCFLLLLF